MRRRALRQIERIGRHLAERHPFAASAFLAEVDGVVERLGDYPLSSPVLREPALRQAKMTGFPYVVIYRVRPPQVTILGVFHAARHPSVRARP